LEPGDDPAPPASSPAALLVTSAQTSVALGACEMATVENSRDAVHTSTIRTTATRRTRR